GGAAPPSRTDRVTASASLRPASCVDVQAGSDLQALVDGAPDRAALCLAPGSYAGPLRLHRAVTIWGPRDAVMRCWGHGTRRDVVVWYSANNRVTGNVVEKGRYGTHLMYSSNNVVAENRYLDDEVGIFVMYSREVQLEGNVIAGGTGAAGMGIGIKESGNLRV